MPEQRTESELLEREFSMSLEYTIGKAAARDCTQPDNWRRFCALIALRTPEQVKRMEWERNLESF